MYLPVSVAGIKSGRAEMYGTWGRVSGAAEGIGPAWQGPQIYGVDVPSWGEMKRFACSFFFFFTKAPSQR